MKIFCCNARSYSKKLYFTLFILLFWSPVFGATKPAITEYTIRLVYFRLMETTDDKRYLSNAPSPFLPDDGIPLGIDPNPKQFLKQMERIQQGGEYELLLSKNINVREGKWYHINVSGPGEDSKEYIQTNVLIKRISANQTQAKLNNISLTHTDAIPPCLVPSIRPYYKHVESWQQNAKLGYTYQVGTQIEQGKDLSGLMYVWHPLNKGPYNERILVVSVNKKDAKQPRDTKTLERASRAAVVKMRELADEIP